MPKALLPLGGKTLLEYQILRLRDAGITDIVINVHHFADKIVEYLRANNNFGCRIQLSDERERLLDTGGGLLKAATLLCDSPLQDEPVLACNVDILSNIDIASLVAAHKDDTLATLVVSERVTQRYLLFDDDLKMEGWTNIATGERRPAELDAETAARARQLAFSGMQVLSPRIFPLMEEVRKEKGDKFSLIDLYLSLCRSETIRAFVPKDYRMMDVGKTDQLSAAEEFAASL